MEQKELTEEQKKKLKALAWSSLKKSAMIGLKYGLLLTFANMVVVALAMATESKTFMTIGALMNVFFIFSAMGRETRKERDRTSEEVKKILEN